MQSVENFLKINDIRYNLYEHPAVYTCEEAEKYHTNPDCTACKNLFIRDKKGSRFFLVVLPARKQADLKALAEIMGAQKVTFANSDELKERLGLTPGSVSLFGLLNDKGKEVELYIDKDIYDANMVSFHPNINTATVELDREMFHKLLEIMGYKVNLI